MLRRALLQNAYLPLTLETLAQPDQHTAPDTTDQGVRQKLAEFLRAFNNLDWPAFRACFSNDATVFHPDRSHARRTRSPQQFEQAWQDVFAQIKHTSGRNSPPYMELAPADLDVRVLSPDVALVTFHLISAERLGRRSLLWQNSSAGWQIVHLHASNFEPPPPATASQAR